LRDGCDRDIPRGNQCSARLGSARASPPPAGRDELRDDRWPGTIREDLATREPISRRGLQQLGTASAAAFFFVALG
jgi:hypothetical protein